MSLAGTLSLLAGILLASTPANAAASSAYTATEVTVDQPVNDIAADPATDTLYTSNGGTGIAVIDGADNTVTGYVDLSLPTEAVAVDQESDSVYAIGGSSTPTADVINGATDTVTATIGLPAKLEYLGAAVNPDTHMVYAAADSPTESVVVIDGTKDTVAATIPLGNTAFGVAVDTATNTIYAADGVASQIAVIDGATNAVTGDITLPAGSDPVAVAVDPAAGLLYVADQGTGAISVINTATDSVSTLASGLTQPSLSSVPTEGLALDTGTGTLYATIPTSSGNDNLGTTYVIDTASGAITDQIPRGGGPVVVPIPGGPAYVAHISIDSALESDVTVLTPSAANTMSPIIVGSDSVTFVATQAGQYQLTVSATPSATFSATDLPDWLTLSPSGLLSGTPPASPASRTAIEITASNTAGSTTQTFTLIVDPLEYQNPSIAWTGTAEVITAADSGGNLDYWWQAAGTSTWHQQQVAAAGAVTYANPSIAWTGTAEVISATDSNGNLDYWWQAAGTGTWHEQQVASVSSGVTYANPSITWTGTAEVITATDSTGDLDYWWQAADTAPWNQQQVATAGTVTYAHPSITWTGTAEVITAQDSEGNLDYWWQAAGTAPWSPQQVAAAGSTATYEYPSITWTGTAEVITAENFSNGNLDYWWQAAGTAPWNQQQVAIGPPGPGGTVHYGPPRITWTGTAEIITAQDSEGNVDYWWQAAGTAPWNQQEVVAAAGTVSYGEPAVAWTGTAEVITGTDVLGNLDYWWQAAGTAPWNEQQVAAGS